MFSVHELIAFAAAGLVTVVFAVALITDTRRCARAARKVTRD